jgi:hypothetical protein
MKQDYGQATAIRECRSVLFCEDHKGTRKYLETELKEHSFWQDLEYWQYSLRQEVKQFSADAAAAKNGSASSSSSSPLQQHQRNEFIVQWMIAASHQMLSFGVAATHVSNCMVELSAFYELSNDEVSVVKNFLANVSSAMAQAAAAQ